MKLGKVVGTVVSTQKDSRLEGYKLLIVKTLSPSPEGTLESVRSEQGYIVAVDLVCAGNGETVLYCSGSSARFSAGAKDSPVDAAIVGIIDTTDIVPEEVS
jgi:microcompartment protein CcmK/EutM